MKKYIHFTQEQKQQANTVDLADFLRRQGEQLTRSGHEWRWSRHDSVTVKDNQWYRHSTEQGGLAIDFAQEFFALSFPEAVTMLLGGEQGIHHKPAKKIMPLPQKPFALPEAHTDMRRVFAYLIKQRYIDRDVISYFAKAKLLYEDKAHHNAVFVGVDKNGVPRHAHKKGTYTAGDSFRGNVTGSDPHYGFHHVGDSHRLYVFEGPIDMLSFLTLYPKNWLQQSYVALNGVSEHALLHMLELYPHLQAIVLCLDHDPAGIEAAGRLTEKLEQAGYSNVSCLLCESKDWNEQLKATHSVAAIPAQPHPKTTAVRELCGTLKENCSGWSEPADPLQELINIHNQIDYLSRNCLNSSGEEQLIAAELDRLISVTVKLAQTLCFQMEHHVKVERLIDRLVQDYRPHGDHDKLSAKLNMIQQGIIGIHDKLTVGGVLTSNEKIELTQDCLQLALASVRSQVCMEMSFPKQERPELKMSVGADEGLALRM